MKPVTENRPDTSNINIAEQFGKQVRQKVDVLSSLEELAEMTIPGNGPYKELKKVTEISLNTNVESCTEWGDCTQACPMEAIDPSRPAETNKSVFDVASVLESVQPGQE